jgi:hypothetical protein
VLTLLITQLSSTVYAWKWENEMQVNAYVDESEQYTRFLLQYTEFVSGYAVPTHYSAYLKTAVFLATYKIYCNKLLFSDALSSAILYCLGLYRKNSQ